MVKIDLITGFLGSGKTTFLKTYAKHWLDQGMNIGIVENDFGAVNVDMMLLQDLMGENCELEMIAGGCDYDCHKRRFKTKLIAMGMCGYDRVIVEPSGIFEVDEFFDILHEEPLDRWYEIGNVIAVVDAKLSKKLSKQSEYLLANQLAKAGQVIISHADMATDEEMQATLKQINQAMEVFDCGRRFEIANILCENLSEMGINSLKKVEECGYLLEDHKKLWFEKEEAYQSISFMNVHLPLHVLKERVEQMFQDEACGDIFRVKGFMPADTGEWYELNATKEAVLLQQLSVGQEILIVIGERLLEAEIEKYLE